MTIHLGSRVRYLDTMTDRAVEGVVVERTVLATVDFYNRVTHTPAAVVAVEGYAVPRTVALSRLTLAEESR